MPRNRIIYQSEALFAGPSPATGYHYLKHDGEGSPTTGRSQIHQIQRVQDASYSFNITRQDVNQFGELAAIDRVILESPTVSLDFSYILANMVNEHNLGFHVIPSGNTAAGMVVSAMSGLLSKATDERNYFIKTVAEGNDALGDAPHDVTANVSTIGIGNAFLTSYTTEAAVGDFPTASISVEGLNMDFVQGVSGNFIPAINPADGSKEDTIKYALPSGMSHATTGVMEADGGMSNDNVVMGDTTSALRPGDVSVSFWPKGDVGGTEIAGFTGVSITDAKIQSYSMSFDLAREPLAKLGNKFAFAREITFPVTVTLTVDANLGDLTKGNLADVISIDSSYDILLKLAAPGVGVANSANTRMSYTLKNAKLDSQEYTSDIGTNKAVSLTFSSQIGGPKQTDKGLFMSGLYKA